MTVTANTGMSTEVDGGPPTRMSSAIAGSDVVRYISKMILCSTSLQSGGDNGDSKGSTSGGKRQFGDMNIGLLVSTKESHRNGGDDQIRLICCPTYHRG